MRTMASQITSLTIVYSTVYSDADERKHQSSASLAFVQGIHRWPMNSPHKWPVMRKMFPFDDVIMNFPTSRWAVGCWMWVFWRNWGVGTRLRSVNEHHMVSLGVSSSRLVTWHLCLLHCRDVSFYGPDLCIILSILKSDQNDWHFAVDIFICTFLKENICILVKMSVSTFLRENICILVEMSVKVIAQGPNDTMSALAQVMAWHQTATSHNLTKYSPTNFVETHMLQVSMSQLIVA